MSKLRNIIYEEHPLVVNPRLAKELKSADAAIIVQQIHYWCNINKEAGRNFHDGRYWTYNSYEKWHEYFPWISVRTLKTIFKSLEQKGYIITGNYNQLKIDRTKWYTVNYDFEIDDSPLCESCTLNSEDASLTLPLTTTHILTEKELSVINSENAVSDLRETRAREERKEAFKVLGEKAREAFADPKNKWAIDLVNKYINEWYEQETGRKHKQMGKALRMIYAYKLVECQQITENDRCAEIEPTDFENALKLAIQCHDCKDPTIMWVTDPKVLGYWLVESGGCFYQDIMSTKYGFSDDAEEAFESWKTDSQM